MSEVSIAIVQHPPKLLDREQTLAQAVQHIQQAAEQGAKFVLFPEAYIAGYPSWIWRLRPGGDWGVNERIHQRLLASAVDLSAGHLAPLCEAAKATQLWVQVGFNELDSSASRASLYNSFAVIDDNGELVNVHRKLMPTNPERMVWGMGDASGLQTLDTPAGRLGGLICWENYMPLARFALYAQGVQLYTAPTYDSGDGWIGSMQHIAREGRCYVACAGVALRHQDIPQEFEEMAALFSADEEWINPGDSVIVAPGGEIIAGPMRNEVGILTATIDPKVAIQSKRALDVAGHYARPDVLSLNLHQEVQSSLKRS
ncbi:carbon-nitrogen hydrolase family protein [Paraferrimonas sedimenticola]|uniref:Nitrilase n=1 Tax=Paraferrimonas sedimenticola TaxID=375674 RepID=A0AA37RTK7_9GAMM|nr:carbon-nitrogen hydrolase family protein [Paraferrimonas sedimenticola]GLP95044.1 nitrilase [Paraferrimonas sedimenticola]